MLVRDWEVRSGGALRDMGGGCLVNLESHGREGEGNAKNQQKEEQEEERKQEQVTKRNF